ncbi:MAG: type II secretion system protein [Gemmataceae bacterium]|nr:type II secretion system GspH family protein [Gemmata sp.]MDW8198528.1 type II secretion system protein [Gemmataceae bacterium]
MKPMPKRGERPRTAMTLVELLVVLAIAATLVALTGAAVYKTAEVQKMRATKNQLFKLQQSLDAEYERIVKQCEADQLQGRVPPEVVAYCDNDRERIRSVWTAMKLRQHFPDSFAEATSGFQIGIPPNTNIYTLQPLATFASLQGVPNPDPVTQSAVLLYIIVAEKSVSGGGAMASSADELGPTRAIALGNRNFRVFLDAYENPVGFQRWRQTPDVQTPDYVDVKSNFHDPLDPTGKISQWPDATKRSAMSTGLRFNNLNRLATVFSTGKDRNFGTDDDLYGYVLRRHGK